MTEWHALSMVSVALQVGIRFAAAHECDVALSPYSCQMTSCPLSTVPGIVVVELTQLLPAVPGAHSPLAFTCHSVQPVLQPPSVQNFMESGNESARASRAGAANASTRSSAEGREDGGIFCG